MLGRAGFSVNGKGTRSVISLVVCLFSPLGLRYPPSVVLWRFVL